MTRKVKRKKPGITPKPKHIVVALRIKAATPLPPKLRQTSGWTRLLRYFGYDAAVLDATTVTVKTKKPARRAL